MGLDMYLSKRTYVKNWDWKEDNPTHHVQVTKNGDVRKDIKPSRITYIIEEVGYWRKFNALHGYIVENYGKGIDECQEIYLELSDLEVMIEVMKEVMKSKPNEDGVVDPSAPDPGDLLPPTQGFFFGGYELDEYYYDEVERTIELFTELVNEEQKSEEENGLWSGSFYYQANW